MSDDDAGLQRVDAALASIRADASNDAAWREVYLFYRRQVAGTLYVLGVQDANDREDLSSEVFFRFLSYSPWSGDWSTLPDRRVIGAYLRTTAHRVAWTSAKKRTRGRGVDEHFITGSSFTDDDDAVVREMLAVLNREEQRFFQRYIESGFSLSRVAALENITYSAVGTRLHRIRAKLKQFAHHRPG